MSEQDDELDRIWRTLGSPWRRRILDLLKSHPRTTNEVWGEFARERLSRFAVMQHLNALERAGLIARRRSGRTTYNILNPTPLKRIYSGWLRGYLTLRPAQVLRSKYPPGFRPTLRRPLHPDAGGGRGSLADGEIEGIQGIEGTIT